MHKNIREQNYRHNNMNKGIHSVMMMILLFLGSFKMGSETHTSKEGMLY